jgi:hypothetical protein
LRNSQVGKDGQLEVQSAVISLFASQNNNDNRLSTSEYCTRVVVVFRMARKLCLLLKQNRNSSQAFFLTGSSTRLISFRDAYWFFMGLSGDRFVFRILYQKCITVICCVNCGDVRRRLGKPYIKNYRNYSRGILHSEQYSSIRHLRTFNTSS